MIHNNNIWNYWYKPLIPVYGYYALIYDEYTELVYKCYKFVQVILLIGDKLHDNKMP